MIAPRKLSVLSVALTVIGLLAVGELALLVVQIRAANKAEARLVQKQRELASVSALEPSLTTANAEAIEADLARARRALDTMRADLRGRGEAAEKLSKPAAPERRPDAYFDIATFVEKMREQAQRHAVALKPDERFGFAEYTNVGPEAELIPAVFRQRLVAQYLLEVLFEAQPEKLISVQREQPRLPTSEDAARNSNRRPESRTSPDFFEVDPQVTARVPGFVETSAFRLAFVGQTAVLRQLLNRLADFQLPVVVRSVEVEPATSAREVARAATADAPAAPLIRRTLSKFAVTVEYVELPTAEVKP